MLCKTAVTYRRHDGYALAPPSQNVIRLREGRIADHRIYISVNPRFGSQELGGWIYLCNGYIRLS